MSIYPSIIRVAGGPGFEGRPPTAKEIERMQAFVREAMQAGAFGLSTGLIYAPQTFAKTEEIIALATIVSEYDGLYCSHIRGEGATVLDAVRLYAGSMGIAPEGITAARVFDEGYATWVGITPDDTERRNRGRDRIQKLAKTDVLAYYNKAANDGDWNLFVHALLLFIWTFSRLNGSHIQTKPIGSRF